MQEEQNYLPGTPLPGLSDKYEDQYERLHNAMVHLFQYETLLNNEYLIRKFQYDPLQPNYYILHYQDVQRENSIKSQYVQNEQNTRKQYHLILTKILNQYNGKLWNYDNAQLIIRPFFQKQRKMICIKIQTKLVDDITQTLESYFKDPKEYKLDNQIYAANNNYRKLYVITSTESSASELFQYLLNIKNKFYIDSIMMEEIDYLNEFYLQLSLKKKNMYKQNSYIPPKSRNYQQQYQDTEQYKYNPKSEYTQKGEDQQQSYTLVRKNSNSQTPKQKHLRNPNSMNQNDFPKLN